MQIDSLATCAKFINRGCKWDLDKDPRRCWTQKIGHLDPDHRLSVRTIKVALVPPQNIVHSTTFPPRFVNLKRGT